MRPTRFRAALAAVRIAALALTIAAAALLTGAPVVHAQTPDAAAEAWNSGDHANARTLYAQRVAADSNDVAAVHRLGLLLAWNRQYPEAIRLLDRLITLDPPSTVWIERANVLAWAGRFDEAEQAFRSILERDPASADALYGLARVASWRGDLETGEQLWRRALATRPDDVAALIGLSQVLRWSGRPGAALAVVRNASRIAPDNADVREQLAWAEAAFRPRFAPSVAAEFDSDDNRLITTALTASGFVGPRLAIAAHGYVRSADDARGTGSLDSRALSLSARFEVVEGWSASGAAGVTERRLDVAATTATFAAGLASPSWLPLSGSVGVSRRVLDGTAVLVERGVTTDEASLALALRATPAIRLEAGASLARFRGETDNNRWIARFGLDTRPTRALRLRPRATAIRFEHDLDEGYFDPDLYALAEIGIGIDHYQSSWSFTGEVAPGVQQVGRRGDPQGTLGLRARVGYSIAPGREIGLGFTLSDLGIERFEAGAAGYRYQAAVLSAGWTF